MHPGKRPGKIIRGIAAARTTGAVTVTEVQHVITQGEGTAQLPDVRTITGGTGRLAADQAVITLVLGHQREVVQGVLATDLPGAVIIAGIAGDVVGEYQDSAVLVTQAGAVGVVVLAIILVIVQRVMEAALQTVPARAVVTQGVGCAALAFLTGTPVQVGLQTAVTTLQGRACLLYTSDAADDLQPV